MKQEEYARRRRQLSRIMGEGTIAILPAAPEKVRSRDVLHGFRQDSDFYYLTGFGEPEAVMVMVPGRTAAEFIVFCRERNAEKETWDGLRAGPQGVVDKFGADDAFPISDIDEILPGLMENCHSVYYTMGVNTAFDQQVIGWVNGLRAGGQNRTSHSPQEIIALDHVLHDMRLYKSRAEIVAMRRSAKVASLAHKRAMQMVRPGLYEYEVEAEYLYEFRRHGGSPSYPPIVGGGRNACILHYTENDQILNDGDLLLVDAGCELEYYASDITRTYPVNGRFSAPQRAIYDLVHKANIAAIDKVRAGNHWNDIHDAAVRVIAAGLLQLGLLKGTPASVIKDKSYQRFFMHRTGHWLGVDVHDVGDYKVAGEWRVLEPGMVLTVEPGIYIPFKSKGVAKKWWGIGVRIEDDVVVTRKGPDVLSKHLVKSADAVEDLMAAGRHSLRKSA
ncbi:MAG: M24 family metallopeptidase [Gammaproteobacteria bacterium]|nr:M24 family metallopeptidase [Gammaproteobacteria bacterium]